MQTTTLGRTGLTVSVAGLGCGGFSRIGITQGLTHAAGIVRAAFDEGVTFFDTAAVYGTQEAVGAGLAGLPRDKYVLSTKFAYRGPAGLITAEKAGESLAESLRFLKTDYIDVFHIHALNAADYGYALDTLLPFLQKAKEQGKIRFLGVTEQFAVDTSHEMFKISLPDNLFDVIMTGYNILNPSAAKSVLPLAIKNNTGVLNMFAVRSALHNPEQLKIDISRILERGQGGENLNENSLEFLTKDGLAQSLTEAAYRFCRHTAGISVTLTGTGNIEHLRENLKAINEAPLPEFALEKLAKLFGNVDCVSGQ
ncbi:MAG: aldo/keto reductase [Oscillospiraceae bacterium]|jgi:aryl-alcohol dehydrogenase-like predicted oxidoreductase|nr:aldo/keto reductase [Oscillospiraceae bacterium]